MRTRQPTYSSQRNYLDQLSPSELAQRLSRLLAQSPQAISHGMAPRLAYGRHRGPSREASRVAAVALMLYQHNGHWWFPLTLRPAQLRHHGGQICLPGGRLEPGESTTQAALREFEEELGLPARPLAICGELATHYVYASDNRVHPVVAIIESPTESWAPDAREVEDVYDVPLASLVAGEQRTTIIREKTVSSQGVSIDTFAFRAPAFRTDMAIRWSLRVASTRATESLEPEVAPLTSRLVWGATAMILDQLAHLLRSVDGRSSDCHSC